MELCQLNHILLYKTSSTMGPTCRFMYTYKSNCINYKDVVKNIIFSVVASDCNFVYHVGLGFQPKRDWYDEMSFLSNISVFSNMHHLSFRGQLPKNCID